MPEDEQETTPVKITLWRNADGYCLERSDDPGVLYVYATHTPKQFFELVRDLLDDKD